MPLASKGAYQYQPDSPETEGLPPHRAAVPVHAGLIGQTAAVRRRYVIALSVAFSLALHGGFFAAAMVWGQGDPLPETADGVSATIQIQVTQEHIRETIAAKPMAGPPEEKVEVLRIETVPFDTETPPPMTQARENAAEAPDDIAPAEAPADDIETVPFDAETLPTMTQAREAAAETPRDVAPAEAPAADIATVPFDAATPPLTQAREAAAEAPQDVAPAEAPAADIATAEAGTDAVPPAPAEADALVAQRDGGGATPGHIQPTVAVVTPPSPPAQPVPELPRHAEASATADTRKESYLPPIAVAGQLPDASHDTAEQQPPRRKRARRAENGATASVAPDGGKRRGARHGSASRVALFAYKRRIRARMMGNLPPGQWGAGRVVIGLRLSRWGQLLGTHVAKSSGSPMIDQAALNCVRMAGPYPRPPAGATPAQLALSMDFRFE